MLRFGFGKKDERDPGAVEAIKRDVRAALSLADDVAISINEIACADPACPILETIILVMAPGKKTVAYKAHGSIEGVTGDALRQALGAGGSARA
ncbi:MAG: hypothetical protein ABWZ80_00680 [Beijerinckiaceae bacterium]